MLFLRFFIAFGAFLSLAFGAQAHAVGHPLLNGLNLMDAYSIAGVKLGMSPDHAEAEALAAGFKQLESPWLLGLSYDQRLAQAFHQRNPKRYSAPNLAQKTKAIARLKGRNGEDLWIYYAALPTGLAVRSVRLTVHNSGLDDAAFERQNIAKYGAPVVTHKALIWCAAAYHKARCGAPLYSDYATLTLNGTELNLSASLPIKRLIESSIASQIK
jgi:hypothetical protein